MAKIKDYYKVPKEKGMKRPEGAGNFDNMDDFNIVKAVILDEGNIQHTPTLAKDIVNKEYVDSLIPVKLNEVANPDASKTFNLGNNKYLEFTSVDRTPIADEGTFNFTASGNFTGDLVHIHQHTGNAGANTNLLHIESEDSDATCLTLTANAAADSALNIITGKINGITIADLTTLTDNSMADTLHRHSELSASDGTPDQALSVDAAGNVTLGDTKELRWLNENTFIRGTDATNSLALGTSNNDRLTIIGNGNVGIAVTDPHSKLEVNGAISSSVITVSASTDNANVAGANTIFADTTQAVTIGGCTGGVLGQVVHIVKITAANNLTIEHANLGSDQPIYAPGSANITVTTYGGVTMICDGDRWFICAEGSS